MPQICKSYVMLFQDTLKGQTLINYWYNNAQTHDLQFGVPSGRSWVIVDVVKTSLHVVSECVHSAITITLHNQFKGEIETGGVGKGSWHKKCRRLWKFLKKILKKILTMKLIMKNCQSFTMFLSLKLSFPWDCTIVGCLLQISHQLKMCSFILLICWFIFWLQLCWEIGIVHIKAPKDFRSGATHIKARVKNQHILTILGVL